MDKLQELENKCAKLTMLIGMLDSIIDQLLDGTLKNKSKTEIWINEAIHQVIYLDKPIPKMTRDRSV